jgi:hypothetical protein
MFTIQSLFDLLRSFPAVDKLFKDELEKEFILGSQYGVIKEIPLMFYDSTSGNRGHTQMAKTPRGKIIFAGPLMVGRIETGILYFMKLSHHIGTSGKGYCLTASADWRSKAYWSDLMADRKISAIKTCRSSTGLGLREAKDLVDKDYCILNPYWQSSYGTVPAPAPSYANAPAKIIDLEFKISELTRDLNTKIKDLQDVRFLNDELRVRARQVSTENQNLQQELTRVLQEFTTYVKQHKPSQTGTGRFNVWEIIGCKQTDDANTIKISIRKALKLYHPDRVFECGTLLQDLAGAITLELNILAKKIK